VGGYYLLAMLTGGEARGMPGSHIQRIQFQGAGDGFPLDDVVVHAELATGAAAIADIQVKRSISFSPGDSVFQKVASQIADAQKARKLEGTSGYAMAIATARSSWKIDGAYQEVLLWARDTESAITFFRKLNREGTSSEAMRTFVATLRSHLAEFGEQSDDETLWRVLRKLQILVFDFLGTGGQSDALVRERCALALDPSERSKAGTLWASLCQIAQELASRGGEITVDELRSKMANDHGFKLAGLRRHSAARLALSEASRHALNDIGDNVGGAKLARHERFELVNASLEVGRYVEIRGDGGVGKSAILKALADQIGIGSNVIFLSPVRTIPRGWLAMRDVIGFDGEAKELLTDLAASGGAILFLDSVDFFEEPARATATDLIREVSSIPGFRVVVTARRAFGVDEPSWLPGEALDRLGRAPIVNVDELTDAELAELRHEAPALGPLLADGHPAREVVRNLFRLNWLIRLGKGAGALRTEAEMARVWWRTADGRNGASQRDRARILRDLAEKSLSGIVTAFETTAFLSAPLNELVASGTLLDLGGEQMVFRHDVFRDWAIANLFHENSDKVSSLPLAQPAPASLFRGVELAARLSLEESDKPDIWIKLLERLSAPGVHGSWRRAVIIALVRSELSLELLTRTEPALLADQGRLLRDLVRIVMALEVKSARKIFGSSFDKLPKEAEDISIPVGPVWRHLIGWALSRVDKMPAGAVPELTDMFTTYAATMWALDPLVKDIVGQLYAWLMEVEENRACTEPPIRPPFGGGLESDRYREVSESLRSSFIVLSGVRPDLADQYVRYLIGAGRKAEQSIDSIIKAPGALPESAPAALAELTAAALINTAKGRTRGGIERPEPFTHLDRHFLSPSPARGPFLKLLLADPKEGLALVRRIVTHACSFIRRSSSITLDFADGERRFSCVQSFYWSRDGQHFPVVSALMALEAWAHIRIDAGEEVQTVIDDILGDGELPAAYMLLVIDVILSHWPKSLQAAVPFVGSPELLAWDRSRQLRDGVSGFGVFGEKEPAGPANRDSLKKRLSRQHILEELLPRYAFGPSTEGEGIRTRLKKALARLGPYNADADFGDPEFMVVAALNRLDRKNYSTKMLKNDRGEDVTVYEYISPKDEADHLAAMQAAAAPQTRDSTIRAELQLALNDAAKQTAELAARAVEWALEKQARGEELADFDQSILISALLLMRNGDAALRAKHAGWAKAQFSAALKLPEDPVHRMRNGLLFNPAGLAAAGLVSAARHGQGLQDARILLELAVRGDPAVAHGFEFAMDDLIAIDERLLRAVLRCAFVGNIRPHLKRYDAKSEEDAQRRKQVAEWRHAALEAEWNWLKASGPEPNWPEFPEIIPSQRPRIFIAGGPARARQSRSEIAFYADHQAAGVWLLKFLSGELIAPAWMRLIVDRYRRWTSHLNGVGLEKAAELSREPEQWNSAYFRLVARSLSGLAADEIDLLCLDPVVSLPDEPFLDAAEALLLALDVVYFDDKGIVAADLLRIRAALIQRVQDTSEYQRFVRNPGYGIPSHLDGAFGALLMCQNGFRTPPRCYVSAIGIPRAVPFIPLLTDLAAATPSLFVLMSALSTARVSQDYPFAQYAVTAAAACMTAFPNDDKFWVDYGMGKQFCAWLAKVLSSESATFFDPAGLRNAADKVISGLIRLGVSEAVAVEGELLAVISQAER